MNQQEADEEYAFHSVHNELNSLTSNELNIDQARHVTPFQEETLPGLISLALNLDTVLDLVNPLAKNCKHVCRICRF